MRVTRRGLLALLLAVAILAAGYISNALVRPARAVDIGDILLVGGIVLVVNTFGSQLNDFINDALGQREAALAGATKVVPIFSVGRGAYIGAAQVVGVPANVRTVQGVATVETEISQLTGALVVPISTRSPSGGSLNRVPGVGVSAVIDFNL
ncbi:MAG TPA: hypothetical protein PK794_08720 [Armatimonadota bacterium]|nr:hypothetical protein [Armatimonadota bacterium]